MRTSRRPWRRAVLPLLVVVGSSCTMSGVSFARDQRLAIVSPPDNAAVTLPFRLSWTATELVGRYRFLVVFDRSPMRPNAALRSLVAQTDPCRQRPDCPDELWLAQNNVLVTDGSSVTIESLTDTRQNAHSVEEHHATVVLIDKATGRRVGQRAWIREFSVERPA
jgi:hypothetical protein